MKTYYLLLLFLTFQAVGQDPWNIDTSGFEIDTVYFSESEKEGNKHINYTPHTVDTFSLFFPYEPFKVFVEQSIAITYARRKPEGVWNMALLDSIVMVYWPERFERKDFVVPLNPYQLDTTWSSEEPAPLYVDTVWRRTVKANALYEYQSFTEMKELSKSLSEMEKLQPDYKLYVTDPSKPRYLRGDPYKSDLKSWRGLISKLEEVGEKELWLEVVLYTEDFYDMLPNFVFLLHYEPR